jgi:hypothetical protein
MVWIVVEDPNKDCEKLLHIEESVITSPVFLRTNTPAALAIISGTSK